MTRRIIIFFIAVVSLGAVVRTGVYANQEIALVSENSRYKNAVVKEVLALSEQQKLPIEYTQFSLEEGAKIASQDYDVVVFIIANVNGALRKEAQDFITNNEKNLNNVVFYTTYSKSNLYRRLPTSIDAIASASRSSQKKEYAQQILDLIQNNLKKDG